MSQDVAGARGSLAVPAAKRVAVVVLGMHRSGTSALAGTIASLGAAAPANVGGASSDNAKGHWEPLKLVDLNNQIFAEVESNWYDWRAFAFDHLSAKRQSYFRDQIRSEIAQEYGHAPLIVFKDPRVCRMVSLYQRAFIELGFDARYVLILRNPAAVAYSLQERDGLNQQFSALLWLRHVLDAEHDSRGSVRLTISFERFVEDWRRACEQVATALDLQWPNEPRQTLDSAAFLDEALVHHTPAHAVLNERDGILDRWVRDAYEALLRLEENDTDAGARATLDRVRLEFDAYSQSFGEATFGELARQKAALNAQKAAASAQLHVLQAERSELEASAGREIAAHKSRIVSLELLDAEKNAALDDAARRIGELQDGAASGAAELTAQASAMTSASDGQSAQISGLRARVAELTAAAEAKAAEFAALKALASRHEMTAATYGSRLEKATDREANHIASAARAKQQNSELAQLLTAAEAQVTEGRQALAEAQERTDQREAEHQGLLVRLQDVEAWGLKQAALLEAKEAEHQALLVRLGHVEAWGLKQAALLEEKGAEHQALVTHFGHVEAWGLKQAALLEDAEEKALSLRGESRLLNQMIGNLQRDVQREKLTVLRPAYRRVYRKAGGLLRTALPARTVEWLKRGFPNPDGIPLALTYQPSAASGTNITFSNVPAATASDVFVFSIINWAFRTQRPQHLAASLAAKGHRVFFVEMELSSDTPELRQVAQNLYVVRLAGASVGHIQPYTGRLASGQARTWVQAFYDFCDGIDASASKSVIVEHPFWWQLARHLSPEFEILFDCMDDIAGFSNTEAHVLEWEHDLVHHCDKLIVSSTYLVNKYRDVKHPHLLRNGGDITHFSPQPGRRPIPSFLDATRFEKGPQPLRVGYVGAIAEWFDVELLKKVAELLPDVEFHLCGSVTAAAPLGLGALSNVTMYGEVPYTEVPAFLERMDVLTIPFQLLPIIQACDPVKFYEYSAMGKPTVTTRLPELQRASHLAFFASTAEEFAAQIRAAAKKGKQPNFQRELRQYAADNTWVSRGDDLHAIILERPKVSVVILSYGDPELTKAAVHSLTERQGNYTNLEILVVDNASAPKAIAEIREFIQKFPNTRLIENGENLGFARGNNVGIRQATGEFILLLNNDAVVAPGAIAAMVSHLQHNPTVGVVGPLTNNIGNEAKLFVDYANMDEMRLAARAAVTGHRGTFAPIRVAAYFAAMFRRHDLEQFGVLSEDYGLGMFEDDDHCETLKSKGYSCALAEDAFVHHHLSATFSQIGSEKKRVLFERNKAIFERKWGPWTPHQYRYERPPSTLDATATIVAPP